MLDMTVLFRDITGKDEETVQKEEIERLNKATDFGNDFLNYFRENKIYFDSKSCELIEEIGIKLRGAHLIITNLKKTNFKPSRLTYEQMNEAIKRVNNEAPPLIKRLEERLRDVIDS